MRIWASLTRAKLWWLNDWVRASHILQLLWVVTGLQTKCGPGKKQWWTSNKVIGSQGSLTHGQQRLARGVQSSRRAPVVQTAEEVHAGSDRKVLECTVHCSLLHMGLQTYIFTPKFLTVQFKYILFILQLQQQSPQCALIVKTLQLYKENPNNQTTPYEQALGASGKAKLPFKRKSQAQVEVAIYCHRLRIREREESRGRQSLIIVNG